MATSTATESTNLLGLRTVIYAAPNLDELKAWYTAILGFGPYFDEPFYVGFNVGGYELGLDPDAAFQAGSTLTYWGVASIEAAYARIQSLGATPAEPITDVGGGIKVATVKDPAGNVLGLIENPHFSLAQ
ncbi:VOC family protein [Fibrella sp. WM1]|uniref:VOC family protein n=1 Tax=Fibrella musci TaxID=3242485 RepID=UPI003522EE1E